MVYRGKVHNGIIVFDGAERLPEGTEVRIEPVGNGAQTEPRAGSPDALMPFAGMWADQREEMEKSLAELHAMKEEEVRRQSSEPDPEL